jgi:hypothetical protein
MHSIVTKLSAVRDARRVRYAERVHAVWQERRRPRYAAPRLRYP